MADLLELASEYRASGLVCKAKLKELNLKLLDENIRAEEAIELRRRVTLVTAMARECLATANYLTRYHERRQWLEVHREKTGISGASGVY